nr:histidine--tRNA ligase, cytoplasmic [Tanacetum cinerariifolium]
PVAPPSPDYVPGPEHPPSPDYVPSPEHPPLPIEIPYVPEPEYPEYLAPSDDEAPLKDQPLPVDALPIAASPDYVADSDLEEDPEKDPEDDQADCPADGGDGDDEPSDDDNDDDTDDKDPKEEPFKEDDKKEEEHLAPTDSLAVPIVDLTDVPEADMLPRKKACLTTPAPEFEIGKSSASSVARQPGPIESDLRRCSVEQAGYGITDTLKEYLSVKDGRLNLYLLNTADSSDEVLGVPQTDDEFNELAQAYSVVAEHESSSESCGREQQSLAYELEKLQISDAFKEGMGGGRKGDKVVQEKEITFPAEAANETEMAVDRRVLTLGGKGSSLSSTSVFEFATDSLPQILKIDPSALARLSSSSTSSLFKLELSVPDYLTPEEARASILLLLNKLLLGGSASPSAAASQLSDILNNDAQRFTLDLEFDRQDNVDFFKNCWPDIISSAICALFDCVASSLCKVADAVAALSCEALKTDTSTAFNLFTDSGDGFS